MLSLDQKDTKLDRIETDNTLKMFNLSELLSEVEITPKSFNNMSNFEFNTDNFACSIYKIGEY